PAVIGLWNGRDQRRRGIVHDRVAFLREADDDQKMPVRALEEEAVELVRAEGDGGDERYACLDELLGLRERVKLRDLAVETARAGIRDVEGPVARALIVVVVHVAGGVIHPGIVDARIVTQDVGVLARARPLS